MAKDKVDAARSLIEDTKQAIESLQVEITRDELERAKFDLRQELFGSEDLNSYEANRFKVLPDIIHKKQCQLENIEGRLEKFQKYLAFWESVQLRQ
jgi:hypothetical protein